MCGYTFFQGDGPWLWGILRGARDIIPPCHSQGGKRRKREKGSRGTQLCDQELTSMQGQMQLEGAGAEGQGGKVLTYNPISPT